MAFTSPMTAVTGATYTAAQFNTHVRDNLNAIWVGTTAGDMAYWTSATTRARLAKGAANTVLMNNGSVPSWSSNPAISGLFAKIGGVSFSPDADYSGGAYADVTGATVTLVLPAGKTYTIMSIASIQAYNTYAGSGRQTKIQTVIDGTAQNHDGANGSMNPPRNEGETRIAIKTGVTSGSKVVKLQAMADGNPTHVTGGYLIAIAFAE